MGLLVPLVEALLSEHRYKAIKGDVLFVGRQTTFLDETSLAFLLEKYGLKLPPGFEYEFDTETRGAEGQRFITDRCFMRSLGVEKVNFLDVTDYEGADIVHDLGYPIPDSLAGRYDFIYNGGCLDNMFNPGIAMTNFAKMLRPGGRIVCFESASSWNSPYLMYSPGWFWDYFVANGFADCKIYLGSFFDGDDMFYGPWDWFYVNLVAERNTWQQTNGPSPAARDNNQLILVALAEKAADSTCEKQPIQLQYRVDPAVAADCKRKEQTMKASGRPVMQSRPGQKFDRYLTPLGKIGAGVHHRPVQERLRKTVRRNLRALKIAARVLSSRVVV